ncbi:DUF2064 domain-containing protein [Nostoc sp. PA-18-2419]|nr:DUF2064 domain-containing protein [Nostoc sp. PA-18-2419]
MIWCRKTIIISTDCLGVNTQILAVAFQKLHTFDLVLGSVLDCEYH